MKDTRFWFLFATITIGMNAAVAAHASEFRAKFKGGEEILLTYSAPVVGLDKEGPAFIENADLTLIGLPKDVAVHWSFVSSCVSSDTGADRSSHGISGDYVADGSGALRTSLTHAGNLRVISYLAQPRGITPSRVRCKQSLKVSVAGQKLTSLQGTDVVDMNL